MAQQKGVKTPEKWSQFEVIPDSQAGIFANLFQEFWRAHTKNNLLWSASATLDFRTLSPFTVQANLMLELKFSDET